ncbi:alpha/beta hydrolase [Glaciihabitans sp. INWT7]|uniref:alpha/beta hydrolase n=1 Tax=Glaciihabitans sp. INWT7 TaxID=2596912 RepID=UPI001625923E|nr:alpha/beta hydrolase [Glaciihabitans sp. INWT7]QNE46403.1 alpha/beta hydrolase [Glaciihabitans sp. INWT7]
MDVIFVHGALVREGAWWWRVTADLLQKRTGVLSRAVALPSCGEGDPDEAAGGLVADAEALRRELDRLGAAIVVCHSYGGTVLAEAGSHPSVSNLLYISSYLPEVGQSQGAIMSGEQNPVTVDEVSAGLIGIAGYDAVSFGARFLQDGDRSTQEEAWRRVTPQRVEAFATPTSQAGWKNIDSTYLICGDDRSTSLELQRFHAARATRFAEIPTGHHPFLTRPDLVVAQLETILAKNAA